MSVKVVRTYDQDLISRVALNCNDIMFNDFKQDIYGEAIYRMQKKLAANYDLMDRSITLSVLDADIPQDLTVTDFREETKVTVNDVPYSKRNETAEGDVKVFKAEDFPQKTYRIWYNSSDKWVIDYYNPIVGDTIVIDYLSLGEAAATTTGSIFIPEKYQEELIRLATVYMGRLGMAKFLGQKQEKYLAIIRTYTHQSAKEEQYLEKDEPWIFIKPLQYP